VILTDQSILTQSSENIKPEEYQEVFNKLETVLQQTPNAVGLAAPQLGIMKKAFVIFHNGKIHRFANSRIVNCRNREDDEEACLSIPDRRFNVSRFHIITIKDDVNGLKKYVGKFARVVQHEHDHTRGITLVQSGVEVK